MRLFPLHPWWLFCWPLWASILPVLGEQIPLANSDAGSTPNDPQTTIQPSIGEAQDGHQLQHEENNHIGHVQVQEALLELRSVQASSGPLAYLDKKSGLVGATAYYAKEAFVLLFMNNPQKNDYLNPEAAQQKLSRPLAKAVKLLEDAAREQNQDAIYLLAEMNFYGNYSHPRNFKEAFRRYLELATMTGNSSAQHMVGFIYATGIGGAVSMDQAKALTYYTFAAQSGNTKSEMTAGFRHHAGIGAPRNCNEAASYYKKVADKAISLVRSGPPGGLSLPKHAYRLADEEGGVYGEGASVISSGINANRAGPQSDQNADPEDVLEYYDLMSRRGDLKATFALGMYHYEGSRTVKRNFKTARRYFTIVTRKYWAKDDSVISETLMGTGKLACKAAGYLGRLYLRGEGVEQSFSKALKWFKLGLQNGDPQCQYEIGLMHLHGLGVRKDPVLASTYFKEAAQQDWAHAQVELGMLFLDQGDVQTATNYFDVAARHGNIFAYYHLAEISVNGLGRERSCALATSYYKAVVERIEPLHSSFTEANAAYEIGDKETALILYMMAAEQGSEIAQANVAFILDEYRSILSLDALLPWKTRASSLLRNGFLALVYWTRSAKQSNIDSMVKMGDYYLKGFGVDADMEKAAACYQSAAEIGHSAQAFWNLGWMHENGVGVEQDYHLAKRFYDQALENTPESYLPVKLSLIKLRARSYWNTITHGKINSIQPDPEDKQPLKTWSEWLSAFLEDEQPSYHTTDEEDFNSRVHDTMPEGDDYYDEIDEGVMESLIIITLAGTLAFLVYYRQLRQQNQRRLREEEERRQGLNGDAGMDDVAQPLVPGQQLDGGFFPPRNDPNFAQWIAGGVGH